MLKIKTKLAFIGFLALIFISCGGTEEVTSKEIKQALEVKINTKQDEKKLYNEGKEVPTNSQKACLLDDAVACFNAGLMYGKGEGVEKDYVKAVEFYKKAYDKLNIEGQ